MQARVMLQRIIRQTLCLAALSLPADLALADPSPAIAPGNPDQNRRAPQPPLGCSRADWLAAKCSQHPSTSPEYPDNRPRHPHYHDPYRRPVIINQSTPATVEEMPTSDDWESCRKAKVNQLNAQQGGDQARARDLDEWLWKNCRGYSEDLRQLEQDRM